MSVNTTQAVIKHAQKCCFSTMKASIRGLQLVQEIISSQVVCCDLSVLQQLFQGSRPVTWKLVVIKGLLLQSWMQDSFLETCRERTRYQSDVLTIFVSGETKTLIHGLFQNMGRYRIQSAGFRFRVLYIFMDLYQILQCLLLDFLGVYVVFMLLLCQFIQLIAHLAAMFANGSLGGYWYFGSSLVVA